MLIFFLEIFQENSTVPRFHWHKDQRTYIANVAAQLFLVLDLQRRPEKLPALEIFLAEKFMGENPAELELQIYIRSASRPTVNSSLDLEE